MCADCLSWRCPAAWTLALGLVHAWPPLQAPRLHAALPCDMFIAPQDGETPPQLASATRFLFQLHDPGHVSFHQTGCFMHGPASQMS